MKLYFIDPLHARLAHLRRTEVEPPDYPMLTERQLGTARLRAHGREAPGSLKEADAVLYYRSATGREVDFVGHWLSELPYEGKDTEGAW
ncbi:MAG TPA: hypothetical protein VKV23_04305 [Acidimicrobiales bacterium]|nr:hypothetical protein [Acidimicrobiales bacterium]